MSTQGPARDAVVKGVELQLDMILDGLRSVPATTTFVLNGKTYQAADLAKEVESRRAVFKDARDLRNQFHAKTREKRDRRKELGGFVKDVRMSVGSSLGRTNPDLTKFGFEPERERPTLTAEEKARRAELARATRAARHTMGRRQREAIHGEVSETPANPAPSKDGH